eukprot:scaffold2244_cov363-Pavlova_lutheri.AAC.16
MEHNSFATMIQIYWSFSWGRQVMLRRHATHQDRANATDIQSHSFQATSENFTLHFTDHHTHEIGNGLRKRGH